MRQINILGIVTLVSILVLGACDSGTATTAPVSSIPTSVVPTATSQPTSTTMPSPSPTEMPTHTPTLTPHPTPLPDPLLSGQIGFAAYRVSEPRDCVAPTYDGFYLVELHSLVLEDLNLQHWGDFVSPGSVLSWSPDGRWALLHASHDPEDALRSPHSLYLLGKLSRSVHFRSKDDRA